EAGAQVGEPIANSGGLLVRMLCESVRETHKVVLTGQGADEPLGGYPRHVVERLLPLARLIPGPSRWLVRAAKGADDASRLARALAAPTKLDRCIELLSVLAPEHVDLVVRNGAGPARDLAREVVAPWLAQADSGDALNDFLVVDARMSLPDDLLI